MGLERWWVNVLEHFCCCRRPWFDSQHLHGASQATVTPVPDFMDAAFLPCLKDTVSQQASWSSDSHNLCAPLLWGVPWALGIGAALKMYLFELGTPQSLVLCILTRCLSLIHIMEEPPSAASWNFFNELQTLLLSVGIKLSLWNIVKNILI